MRGIAAVMLVAGLLIPGVVRAQAPTVSVADLFQEARSVEIVEISGERQISHEGKPFLELRGRVVEPVRGPPAGAELVFELKSAAVKKGDQILLVQDPGYRSVIAFGLGGAFVFQTPAEGGGIQVAPGLVERASLAALAAGRSAPDLRIAARVLFTDEPVQNVPFYAQVSAGDGVGSAEVAVLGAGKRGAKLLLDGGLPPGAQGGATLWIRFDAGEVVLAGPIAPAKDGWYPLTVHPVSPLARTPGQLEKVLRGGNGSVVVAEGRLTIRSGRGEAAAAPLKVEADKAGRLLFKCKLLVGESPAGTSESRGERLLLPLVGRDQGMLLDLGEVPSGGTGAATTLAARVNADRPPVVFPVFSRSAGEGRAAALMRIGEAVLHHVPDPGRDLAGRAAFILEKGTFEDPTRVSINGVALDFGSIDPYQTIPVNPAGLDRVEVSGEDKLAAFARLQVGHEYLVRGNECGVFEVAARGRAPGEGRFSFSLRHSGGKRRSFHAGAQAEMMLSSDGRTRLAPIPVLPGCRSAPVVFSVADGEGKEARTLAQDAFLFLHGETVEVVYDEEKGGISFRLMP